MKYYVRNKALTLAGESTVTDESGANVLKVAGKAFSPTHKKKVKTLNNKKLFTVRNKFWHFLFSSALIFDADGNKLVKISERVGFGFKVVNYGEDFAVEKEGRSYAVYRSGELVFTVRYENTAKNLIADCYEAEVFKEEDLPLAVAFTIAFDNVNDAIKRRTTR